VNWGHATDLYLQTKSGQARFSVVISRTFAKSGFLMLGNSSVSAEGNCIKIAKTSSPDAVLKPEMAHFATQSLHQAPLQEITVLPRIPGKIKGRPFCSPWLS